MKITGGYLRGRNILFNSTKFTRPTTGKIKEAIFNILSHKIQETYILDLYAGTGALGIEALSRGSKMAMFIDSKKEIIKNISYNSNKLGLTYKVCVKEWNILKNLNCLENIKNQFGIVFVDPPYDHKMIKPSLINLLKSNVLELNACVVVEHGSKEVLPKEFHGLVLVDQRKYGKTYVSFFYFRDLTIPRL